MAKRGFWDVHMDWWTPVGKNKPIKNPNFEYWKKLGVWYKRRKN